MMPFRFILINEPSERWGIGHDWVDALAALKKHGADMEPTKVLRFTADNSFCPVDRHPKPWEPDAYIDAGGRLDYIRCKMEDITDQIVKPGTPATGQSPGCEQSQPGRSGGSS